LIVCGRGRPSHPSHTRSERFRASRIRARPHPCWRTTPLESGDAPLGAGAPIAQLDEVVPGSTLRRAAPGWPLRRIATVFTPRARSSGSTEAWPYPRSAVTASGVVPVGGDDPLGGESEAGCVGGRLGPRSHEDAAVVGDLAGVAELGGRARLPLRIGRRRRAATLAGSSPAGSRPPGATPALSGLSLRTGGCRPQTRSSNPPARSPRWRSCGATMRCVPKLPPPTGPPASTVDGADGVMQRRVGSNRGQRGGSGPQVLDGRARLAAARKHQHGLHHIAPPVLFQQAGWDPCRQDGPSPADRPG
jgi:hypothetical protein